MFLKISQVSQENICGGDSFNKVAGLREMKMFPFQIGEVFKNTFFYRTPPVAASVVFGGIQSRYAIKILNFDPTPPCTHL